jgi:hypothetical protein
MNGPGRGIHKILTHFRREQLSEIRKRVLSMQKKDLDKAFWNSKVFLETHMALAAHEDFDNKKVANSGKAFTFIMADAYICGYWRGLRDAEYELTKKKA